MIKLPHFRPSAYEKAWVHSEVQTARLVRTLWNAASAAQRLEPEFLAVLARATWVNSSGGSDDASQRLRNGHLATWLGLGQSVSDSRLAERLVSELGLSTERAKWVVRSRSGITHYYKPLRPRFVVRLKQHARAVRGACDAVSKSAADPAAKVRAVVQRVLDIPSFKTPAGGTTTMLNGLSPLLACIDPQRRFPIMNSRTARLLAALGERNDPHGALALTELIGQFGLHDSFELDVYASSGRYSFPPARRRKVFKAREPVTIGLKAEEDSAALLRRRRLVIRHRHNVLINKFVKAIRWTNPPVESQFDALIDEWKPGRRLLVEAKPSLDGVAGRGSLRMAIGQLLDYRWRNFPNESGRVDLALLTDSRPDSSVLSLLASLKIAALWFERGKLTGTIALSP